MSNACTDHKGREFPSMRAMCKAWGVDWRLFMHRRQRRWPLDKALTAPKADLSNLPGKPVTDYAGRGFPSIAAMARWYGLPYTTVYWRLRYGWHPERVALEPVNEQRRRMSDDQGA